MPCNNITFKLKIGKLFSVNLLNTALSTCSMYHMSMLDIVQNINNYIKLPLNVHSTCSDMFSKN